VDAVAEHNAGTGRSGGPALSIGSATFDPERPSSLEELMGAAEPAAVDEP
jgi:hypothetical protein